MDLLRKQTLLLVFNAVLLSPLERHQAEGTSLASAEENV